ncbi:disease resistance protein RPV1-like [Ziziphus jujuba]|uniref:Disease resistance protein RPV1-like n=1 Tax=Ziziphus jujuba TaxID=326968 RepID=A0ABM3I081_ZIZJJ|nr:disease resistance protein RPV1-like [Ziziphus jujuba]
MRLYGDSRVGLGGRRPLAVFVSSDWAGQDRTVSQSGVCFVPNSSSHSPLSRWCLSLVSLAEAGPPDRLNNRSSSSPVNVHGLLRPLHPSEEETQPISMISSSSCSLQCNWRIRDIHYYLSENYASSARCLDELVEILECRKSFGRLVWPVFLGVKPSEVINQTGNFEKALAEYEGSSDRKKEKLAKWKDALTQASSLSGWHLGDGYESLLIQRIVEAAEAALRKINRRVPLHVAKYPVGIEDRFVESEPLIDVGTGKNDVKFIGIYGIGGVGKTTIAKALFNKFADEFEGSSFLTNVIETSKQNLGFVQLQGKLLFDMLGDKNLKVGNVIEVSIS